MADYGLKISKQRFPVSTVNKDEQVYNSSNNYIYILGQARDAPARTIVHGLGFFPMTELFGKDTSNSWWKAWVGDNNAPLRVLFSVNDYELIEVVGGSDGANEAYHIFLSTSLSYA